MTSIYIHRLKDEVAAYRIWSSCSRPVLYRCARPPLMWSTLRSSHSFQILCVGDGVTGRRVTTRIAERTGPAGWFARSQPAMLPLGYAPRDPLLFWPDVVLILCDAGPLSCGIA